MKTSILIILSLLLLHLKSYSQEAKITEKPNAAFIDVFNPKPLMDQLTERTNNAKDKKMSFLVFGDSKGAPAFKDVLKQADLLKPDFCITTADLVNKGAGSDGLIDYAKLNEDGGWFFKKYATWPTVGNHEIAGGKNGIENFAKFFGIEKPNYSFVYGNAKFIALPWKKASDDPKLFKWLEDELKNSKETHKFIYRHRPYYTVGSKDSYDVPNKHDEVTKLFEKYKVTAVFSGHDHIYYRSYRNNVHYIISAGAGANIYSLNRQKEAIAGDVFYGAKKGLGYIFVNQDGKETTVDRFHYVLQVNIDDEKVRIKVFDTNGEVRDSHDLKPQIQSTVKQ